MYEVRFNVIRICDHFNVNALIRSVEWHFSVSADFYEYGCMSALHLSYVIIMCCNFKNNECAQSKRKEMQQPNGSHNIVDNKKQLYYSIDKESLYEHEHAP